MALLECSKCGASVNEEDQSCAVCKNAITADGPEENAQDEQKEKDKPIRRGCVVIAFIIVALFTVAAFIILWVSFGIEVFHLFR